MQANHLVFLYDVTRDTTEWSASIYDKFSFSAGAYAEVSLGVCYPFKKWDTSAEKNQLAVKMKLRAELGAKLEVGIPKLNLPLVMTNEPLPQLSLYRLLNTQSDVSLMGYGKLSIQGELGKWKGSFDPEIDVLKTGHFGIVPNITGINVTQDKEEPIRPYRLLLAAPLESGRQLILPKDIGFAVYDKNGAYYTDSICDGALSSGGCTDAKWANDGLYRAVFTNIDPGKGGPVTYTAYPMVKHDGWKLLVDKKTFTLDAARFDIEKRELNIVQEEGYYNTDLHMEVIPNMKNVDIKSEADWITELYFKDVENDLWITWKELPQGVGSRRGVIRLKGLSSKNGEVLVEDSIVVHQAPPYIELSTDSLIFDIKGGTKSLSVVSTNLENLRLVPVANDKYIKSCKLEDDVITVTLDKSDENERKSFIRVFGDGPSGRIYDYFGFWVKQCEDKTIPTVDPERLDFDAQGGEGVIKFYKGKYPYGDVYVSDEGKSWAHATLADNGVVTVTVDPNETSEDRRCYVICYASDKPNPTDKEMVKLAVVVEQDGKRGSSFDVNDYELVSAGIDYKMKLKIESKSGTSETVTDNYLYVKSFIITQSGDVLHVSGENGETKFDFDIVMGADSLESSTVKNVRIVHDTDLSWGRLSFSASNIPIDSYSAKQGRYNFNINASWEATESKGLSVYGFAPMEQTVDYGREGTGKVVYSYVSDPENMVKAYITLKRKKKE